MLTRAERVLRLSYVGPPSRVGILAEMLEDGGLDVQYVPPRPSPPGFEVVTAVALFVQAGPWLLEDAERQVERVMADFRIHHPQVRVTLGRRRSGTEG